MGNRLSGANRVKNWQASDDYATPCLERLVALERATTRSALAHAMRAVVERNGCAHGAIVLGGRCGGPWRAEAIWVERSSLSAAIAVATALRPFLATDEGATGDILGPWSDGHDDLVSAEATEVLCSVWTGPHFCAVRIAEEGTISAWLLLGGRASDDAVVFRARILEDRAERIKLLATALAAPLQQLMDNVAVLDKKEGSEKFQSILKLDGGPRHLNNDLGLKDGDGKISVELAALIQAAVDGDETDGITLVGDDPRGGDEITIAVKGDWSTDHFTFKGEIIEQFLASPTAGPLEDKGLIDLKNKASQTTVFDFATEESIFVGNDADVDSAAARAILSGSRMQQDEATDLVQLALDGDPNVRVALNIDGAVLDIDASRDTTDTVIIVTENAGDLFF